MPRRTASPVAETELGHGGVVLEAKQDELFLADGLALLDQDLAAAVGVEMVGDAASSLLAKLRGRLGLESQGRRRIELPGNQSEQDLADPGRGERPSRTPDRRAHRA